jgi:hypothetical protein
METGIFLLARLDRANRLEVVAKNRTDAHALAVNPCGAFASASSFSSLFDNPHGRATACRPPRERRACVVLARSFSIKRRQTEAGVTLLG